MDLDNYERKWKEYKLRCVLGGGIQHESAAEELEQEHIGWERFACVVARRPAINNICGRWRNTLFHMPAR
eukprot:361271-Chlamydomonas_euryale.AAC.2